MSFAPWWLGALLLSGVTLVFWYLFRRPLGVSGSWTRLVQARSESATASADRIALENPEALAQALMAATQAQFGTPTSGASTGTLSLPTSLSLPDRLPWPAHLTFLVSIGLGGLLASLVRGGPLLKRSFGPAFESFFGSGPASWAVILLGGMLVGFGTRMAGGCTSGHGLSGVSRLQPGSLAATAAFFGTGVAFSLALSKVLS